MSEFSLKIVEETINEELDKLGALEVNIYVNKNE